MSDTTHDKILEVASRTFAEKGYNGTSMREISEALDITKAALYYHFPGKEEIFTACITHSLDSIVCDLEELANTDLPIWDKLGTMMTDMCNFSTNKPYTFKLFKQVASQSFDREIDKKMLHDYFNRQRQAIIKMVEKGVKHGEIRDDIPPELLASAMTGLIHHTTGPKMREMAKINYSFEDQVTYLMKLIQGGFKKT